MNKEPALTDLYKTLSNDALFKDAILYHGIYHSRNNIIDSIDVAMNGEQFWIADEDMKNNEMMVVHRPSDGEHTERVEIVDSNISTIELYNIMMKLVDIPHRRKILGESIKISICDNQNEHDLGCLIEQLQKIYENRPMGVTMTANANISIQPYRRESMADYEERILNNQ